MIKNILLICLILLFAACTSDKPSDKTDTAGQDVTTPNIQIVVPEDPISPLETEAEIALPEPDVPEVGTQLPQAEIEVSQVDVYVAPLEPSVCPDPADCETLEELSVGHGEPVGTLQFNPDLKDPIAIWAGQIGGIMVCVDDGEAMKSCVADSDATEACKAKFLELSNKNEGAELAVFDALFLGSVGPCALEGDSK